MSVNHSHPLHGTDELFARVDRLEHLLKMSEQYIESLKVEAERMRGELGYALRRVASLETRLRTLGGDLT